MEVFEGHRALLRPLVAPAVALGSFDGLHLGHRELIARTISETKNRHADAVLYTFDPHPAQILAPDQAPPLLTSRARKLELLEALGIDVVILEPFTDEFARCTAADFADLLATLLGARHLVVGYDFMFGKDRQGNGQFLREFGARKGISVDVVSPITSGQAAVSSSRIRKLLGDGNVEEAAALLARPYDVDGVVKTGAGRGRTIGFPTANVHGIETLLPGLGVYAVRCTILATGAILNGVANLGYSPTFGATPTPRLEAHLFDFAGDLVGQRVRIHFVARIRGEIKFAGPAELIAQITRDAEAARAVHVGRAG